MNAPWRVAATAAVLLLASGVARADEDRGRELLREAQRLLAAGQAEPALEVLERARVEWPGSALVANTLGDALLAAGRHAEALAEYERGLRDGLQGRARFNRGVTRHRQAESWLSEAGVPLDPAGLPEGPQPELLTAIERAQPELVGATEEFFAALDGGQLAEGAGKSGTSGDAAAAARQSIGALNRRLDGLRAMAEELRRRQEEQQPKEDESSEDQPQEGEQEPKDKPQDKPQDSDEPQQGEGEPPPEPREGEPNPEPSPQDGEPGDEQEQPQPQEPQPSEPEPQGERPPEKAPSPQRLLSEAEVQRLLEKLAALEQEARALQKAREAARRRTVEKDW
ncbi:MAG: tetratricopeptide repeat protein [Planctomycetota bacterium]